MFRVMKAEYTDPRTGDCLRAGQTVKLLQPDARGWALCELLSGGTAWAPLNYLAELSPPPTAAPPPRLPPPPAAPTGAEGSSDAFPSTSPADSDATADVDGGVGAFLPPPLPPPATELLEEASGLEEPLPLDLPPPPETFDTDDLSELPPPPPPAVVDTDLMTELTDAPGAGAGLTPPPPTAEDPAVPSGATSQPWPKPRTTRPPQKQPPPPPPRRRSTEAGSPLAHSPPLLGWSDTAAACAPSPASTTAPSGPAYDLAAATSTTAAACGGGGGYEEPAAAEVDYADPDPGNSEYATALGVGSDPDYATAYALATATEVLPDGYAVASAPETTLTYADVATAGQGGEDPGYQLPRELVPGDAFDPTRGRGGGGLGGAVGGRERRTAHPGSAARPDRKGCRGAQPPLGHNAPNHGKAVARPPPPPPTLVAGKPDRAPPPVPTAARPTLGGGVVPPATVPAPIDKQRAVTMSALGVGRRGPTAAAVAAAAGAGAGLDEEAADNPPTREVSRDKVRGRSVLTVKEGSLLKRAQGKSLLGRTNWKIRFFVLTLNCLSYYDNFDVKQRSLKGQILLETVESVERVRKFEKDFLLALHYKNKSEYTLHLQANSERECEDWLEALQTSVAACHKAHNDARMYV